MKTGKKIAVVTGANRGIGFEVCRGLARMGIHVILTSRDKAKGLAACETLAAEGLDTSYRQLDVTNPESIQHLETFIQDTGSPLFFGEVSKLYPSSNPAFPCRERTGLG